MFDATSSESPMSTWKYETICDQTRNSATIEKRNARMVPHEGQMRNASPTVQERAGAAFTTASPKGFLGLPSSSPYSSGILRATKTATSRRKKSWFT
jgi:hypothetical protein